MEEILHKQGHKRWKSYLTWITLAALGLSVFFLRDQIVQVFHDIGRVNYWALFLILPIQFVNYHSYAKMYQRMYGTLGEKLRYWLLFRVQLELNFVNHVFPSGGVTGISYFGLRMKDEGVSAGKSTLIQVMKFGLLFMSYEILLLVGLFCLAVVGKTNNLTILVLASLATMMVVLTLGGMFVVSSEKRVNDFFTYMTQVLNKLIHVVRPKYPETINISKVQGMFTELHHNYVFLQKNYKELKWPLFYALMANLTEILTVYVVYIAFGQYVNFGAVIIAYAIANFAGLISVLPGGIGIYEGLMTAVLATAGISPAVSIPVTVMYRVLNTLVQLPPGYYFYHKNIHKELPSKEPLEEHLEKAGDTAEALDDKEERAAEKAKEPEDPEIAEIDGPPKKPNHAKSHQRPRQHHP